MIYYMVRHKASGEFMPQMRRGKGYSHWNPTTGKLPVLAIGVPRLISSRRQASRIISQWNSMPNTAYYPRQEGEYDLDFKADGRKKEDLEVVEVNIEEVKYESQ